MNRDQKIALIEAKANEMLRDREYQFVTIAELTDEINEAGHEINLEEVEQLMEQIVQSPGSEWISEPMPDSPGQLLYSKDIQYLLIEEAVEEMARIQTVLSKKAKLSPLSPETWQIAAEVQRNMILKQQK